MTDGASDTINWNLEALTRVEVVLYPFVPYSQVSRKIAHDGTDTLAKALTHWQKMRGQGRKELRSLKGKRRQVIRRQLEATEARIATISEHIQRASAAEAERAKRQQWAEEMELWQSFDRLCRNPTEENARIAKRAFLSLAKRHHPDQGGTHEGFLRVKNAYDRARTAYRFR